MTPVVVHDPEEADVATTTAAPFAQFCCLFVGWVLDPGGRLWSGNANFSERVTGIRTLTYQWESTEDLEARHPPWLRRLGAKVAPAGER